jgi:hypothetical protein
MVSGKGLNSIINACILSYHLQIRKKTLFFINQCHALKISIYITLMRGDKKWILAESEMMNILFCKSNEINNLFTSVRNNHVITTFTTKITVIKECLFHTQLERAQIGSTFVCIDDHDLTGFSNASSKIPYLVMRVSVSMIFCVCN